MSADAAATAPSADAQTAALQSLRDKLKAATEPKVDDQSASAVLDEVCKLGSVTVSAVKNSEINVVLNALKKTLPADSHVRAKVVAAIDRLKELLQIKSESKKRPLDTSTSSSSSAAAGAAAPATAAAAAAATTTKTEPASAAQGDATKKARTAASAPTATATAPAPATAAAGPAVKSETKQALTESNSSSDTASSSSSSSSSSNTHSNSNDTSNGVVDMDSNECFELGKLADPQRNKFQQMLYGAFGDSLLQKLRVELACKLENTLFTLKGGLSSAYKDRLRVLLNNLRDANNPDLRERLISGDLTPETVVECDETLLASKAQKQERERLDKEAADRRRTDWDKYAGECDEFKCGKCKERRCTYYQKQTRSADEPMTTFVTCLACGHRWRFC